MYIISIILTVFLLYVAINTRVSGNRLPQWALYSIALLTLASWESAIVMLGISIYCIIKGVKSGEVRTLDWIENLID